MKRTTKWLFTSSAVSYLSGVFAFVWHHNIWWPFLGGWISGLLLMSGLSQQRLGKI